MAPTELPGDPRPDPWSRLRQATPARIGLGRAGDAPPLQAVLDFQLAHARARDAVHTPLDIPGILAGLGDTPHHIVHSRAVERGLYLRRPDLGRVLAEDSRAALPAGQWDAVFIIADGLSATAVQRHAVPLWEATVAKLTGWKLAPVVVATGARVALSDEIGAALGAGLAVMLIGERPGLSVADSLGVYLTWAPKPGLKDSARNCISNIHLSGGLSYAAASAKLAWLMTEARHRRLTGVALKDEQPAALPRP
ncbi:ethanolamine ammonia-lyase [Pseudoroseomonas deserti]|uniref:Ethanolamine ammonia-lyase small subunit n=1 Tax=Teichococcus deserti TaxID=1817963 RepID=A0A1V2H0P4_9PROT|nr:ethanolamine ammonia-lyase subunit EutC [Pseudoroseomonas deserti]ONG52316.1 ethanolamine ammonia-lyase [Pseudoroseomonas deserti]